MNTHRISFDASSSEAVVIASVVDDTGKTYKLDQPITVEPGQSKPVELLLDVKTGIATTVPEADITTDKPDDAKPNA